MYKLLSITNYSSTSDMSLSSCQSTFYTQNMHGEVELRLAKQVFICALASRSIEMFEHKQSRPQQRLDIPYHVVTCVDQLTFTRTAISGIGLVPITDCACITVEPKIINVTEPLFETTLSTK